MPLNKIKLSQEDFNNLYEIDKPIEKSNDTTKDKDEEGKIEEPEFLTEEQEEQDEALFSDLPSMEEDK